MALGLAINVTPPTGPVKLVLQSWLLLTTSITLILLAGPLVGALFREVCQRRVTVEALFLSGLLGAFGASVLSMIRGEGPVYFEVVSIVLLVYTFGKAVTANYRARAVEASQAWAEQIQTCIRVDDDGTLCEIDVRDVQLGDRIEVHPGQLVAVDGVVLQGVGFVRESSLTGEAFPVIKREGDVIWAGTLAEDARFLLEARSQGHHRRIDHLIESVERARLSSTSLQAQADRLARLFLPIVLSIALATFLAWLWLDNWSTGLFNALSVLLVACPCALGLVTPIAVWTAIGRLADLGVILRGGDGVERLAEVNRIVFDKTGTLTEDQAQVIDLVTQSPEVVHRSRLISWIAAIEERSDHPFARGFLRFTEGRSAEQVTLTAFRVVPGRGVEAELLDETGSEHAIRIGRRDWIEAPNQRSLWNDLVARLQSEDATLPQTVAIEVDGNPSAMATWTEKVRDSTRDVFETCQAMGMPMAILTGDTCVRQSIATSTTASIEVIVECPPEQKAAIVEKWQGPSSRILFVGDGINDAPAMASAHAGMAMATGTDLTCATADATLYRGDLRVVPATLAICRQTTRIVRENIVFAATYNLIGITMASLGVLHPVVASILMVCSSLFVVWRSSRASDPQPCDCWVGSEDPETIEDPRSRCDWLAATHAIGLSAQGVILGQLLGLTWPVQIALVAAFAVLAIGMSLVWKRWRAIPSGLDMAFGMATLGSLGMVLGWWADLGFRSLAELDRPWVCLGHRALTDLTAGSTELDASLGSVLQPGMYLGMMLFAQAAMYGLRRRPEAFRNECSVPTLLLAHLGMVLGMGLGGMYAEQLEIANQAARGLSAYLFMNLGMILGMAAGHQLGNVGFGWKPKPRGYRVGFDVPKSPSWIQTLPPGAQV